MRKILLKIRACGYFFRCLFHGLKYLKGVRVGSHLKIKHKTKVFLSEGVWIGPNVCFWGGGTIVLGKGTHIGPNSSIYASKEGGVKFGENVNCAMNLFIIDANHGYKLRDVPINKQPMEVESISIGDNCWIGANCTFIKGASIGNGNVVGACSLVNHKFSDNNVIAGVPAKVIKSRFN